MHTVFVVLGGMLAGAAVFTAVVATVYLGIACLLQSPASDTLIWLSLPNLMWGPFAGATLGIVGALCYRGYGAAAHGVATITGAALLGAMVFWGVKEMPGERPGVYTVRQGVPVILRVGVEVIGGLLFMMPVCFLVGLGLIVWGIMGR